MISEKTLQRMRVIGVFCSLAWVSGCMSQATVSPEQVNPPGLSVVSDRYLIQPGDKLAISVWGEEKLARQTVVLPDGRFSFPLVGDLVAGGKTTQEIDDEITDQLVRFMSQPEVTVSVIEATGNKIYVIGMVNRPGEFPLNRTVDVMQALTMAGGTSRFADLNDIKILRRNKEGKSISLEFRYKDVVSGRRLDQNILLQVGDVVVVP